MPHDQVRMGSLLGTEDFLAKSWPHEPYVFHHALTALPEIWRLPDLQSLDSALGVALPGSVFANLPGLDEEFAQIPVPDAADAKKAFAARMGLSMEPDPARLTELVRWLRALQRELGLAKQTFGRCNVYAIPDGGRTGGHYDQNINLVCQITGEKTWVLAPNTHVVNPVMRHTLGTPPDRATLAYAKGDLPISMPQEGRTQVVLKRGSVLFVPRGYWHETSARGDSISLNFTYDQPCWAQVLATALARRLMRNEAWRSVACGLQSEGPLRERAEKEFTELLRAGLGEFTFDDLV